MLDIARIVARERAAREEYLKGEEVNYAAVEYKVIKREQEILAEIRNSISEEKVEIAKYQLIYSDSDIPLRVESESSLKEIAIRLLCSSDKELDTLYVLDNGKIKHYLMYINEENERCLDWVE